jgi:hypothetical protein
MILELAKKGQQTVYRLTLVKGYLLVVFQEEHRTVYRLTLAKEIIISSSSC